MTNEPLLPFGGSPVDDRAALAEALRRLLAAPRCVPARTTGRTLVGRKRRVVPVAELRSAV